MGRATLRPALRLALAVGLTGAAAGGTAAAGTDPFEAMQVQRPAEPVPAPDLAFTALDGRPVRLSALRGKVVLLGFFTTT
jgi:cytochrome oxidase Cu insertion factor (SCO1/SenC/PrrC family)